MKKSMKKDTESIFHPRACDKCKAKYPGVSACPHGICHWCLLKSDKLLHYTENMEHWGIWSLCPKCRVSWKEFRRVMDKKRCSYCDRLFDLDTRFTLNGGKEVLCPYCVSKLHRPYRKKK